jgi:uncharacterized protein YbjQ (UPF0145 family)
VPLNHNKVSGFSGNEVYCLDKLGYEAGQLCLGNNVLALGIVRGISSSFSSLIGGEIEPITRLIRDGRTRAIARLKREAATYGGIGIAGVSFNLIHHGGNIECIATGSTIHTPNTDGETFTFSTSATAQQLYCQLDAGFTPHEFVFGNVAYSIGLGGNIGGALRGLGRGEVPQYSNIFDKTRHLALTRIKAEAQAVGANAVVGITTSILPLLGAQEMVMLGTAATHPALEEFADSPATSELSNEELWNLVNLGYMPIQLVMGVSVYSLGITSGIGSVIKSFIGGEVEPLTELLYEAREKALERIQQDARACNADKVVGVKTRIFDLGGGLVEFMVIGTAVRRMAGISTKSENLPPQAFVKDQQTFVDTQPGAGLSLDTASATPATPSQRRVLAALAFFVLFAIWLVMTLFNHRSD